MENFIPIQKSNKTSFENLNCIFIKEINFQTPNFTMSGGVHGVFDAEEVHQLLQKERLKDVTTIAIPPEKNFCDHMVIATASNKRQLSAVAEKIRIMVG